jgi:hypothetical protein
MCGGVARLLQPAVLVKSSRLKVKSGLKTNHPPHDARRRFLAIDSTTMHKPLSLAGPQVES